MQQLNGGMEIHARHEMKQKEFRTNDGNKNVTELDNEIVRVHRGTTDHASYHT